jgi:ribosomal protein L17
MLSEVVTKLQRHFTTLKQQKHEFVKNVQSQYQSKPAGYLEAYKTQFRQMEEI